MTSKQTRPGHTNVPVSMPTQSSAHDKPRVFDNWLTIVPSCITLIFFLYSLHFSLWSSVIYFSLFSYGVLSSFSSSIGEPPCSINCVSLSMFHQWNINCPALSSSKNHVSFFNLVSEPVQWQEKTTTPHLKPTTSKNSDPTWQHNELDLHTET